MYQYFKGSIFEEHSDHMREDFLKSYRIASYTTKKWVATKIPKEQQEYFEQFIFPMPSYDSRDFSFTKLAKNKLKTLVRVKQMQSFLYSLKFEQKDIFVGIK